MKKKVVVIGAGISGLAASALLAHSGKFDVTVLEKNSGPGGRARQFKENGFIFDLGPSWYMMHEVFERFFSIFGKTSSDYYSLKRLDPVYKIFFDSNNSLSIPDSVEKLMDIFENYEKGAGENLKKYLTKSKQKYEIAVDKFLYKNYLSVKDIASLDLLKNLIRLNIFGNYHNEVSKYFKNEYLQKILEWEVTFIGASPYNVPAMYSLMTHVAINLGVYHPDGGMYSLIIGLEKLAKENNVKFIYDADVTSISDDARIVTTNQESFNADIVLSTADYYHTETQLISKGKMSYTKRYWEKKVLSPSTLLFFLGINKRLNNFEHHNYLFDENWEKHFEDIYNQPKWPNNPMMYISNPNKTDKFASPEGQENLFVLIPIAPGIEDNEEIRKKYLKYAINKIQKINNTDIKSNIVYSRSYCIKDFENEYYAYKGHAFGLANTLFQTAIFRPSMRSKKIKNLFYAGCMTNPGVGLPTSLISGQVASDLIIKEYAQD